MASYEVNHKVMRDAAAAINEYCAIQDREMRSADTEIQSMLSTDWIGLDAQVFASKWQGVGANDSTTIKFRDSLKNYGNSLTACANEYQSAQEDAYNLAFLLPKVFNW